MKKYLIIVAVMFFGIYISGCGKKKAVKEESTEQLSMETLSTINTGAQTQAPAVSAPEVKGAVPQAQVEQAAPSAAASLEPLPPAGPYSPTVKEIQTALKNAGFYAGAVDGKKGHMTKKAIEEFQKANNLKADGKVGPKTWGVLNAHLNPPVVPAPQPKKK